MSDPDFQSHLVVLQVVAEINGRQVMAKAAVEREAWSDVHCQEAFRADLLRTLGEAIVKELNPEITVDMPKPSLREALAEELRPFDCPYEEMGL
ncbi:hypothetical protein [Kitasatospora sp. NPDC047058]|uniref:hypothetical protein n=1 Tax=Kitasatospora sp. NPDC047058 TaxID=3155620 RepID=UPI0033C3E095